MSKSGSSKLRGYLPVVDGLESRVEMATGLGISPSLSPPGYLSLGNRQSPVVPRGAAPEEATFIDPTTNIQGVRNVGVGYGTYVGPFVQIMTGRNKVLIGNGSDLQDNVMIDARRGTVVIGDEDVIAHGASVIGPAKIGGDGNNPAFIGFNAVIQGATVEPGTYVSSMAKVGPGVVIRTGMKVLPGVYVRTQAEADDVSLGKVAEMTEADKEFVQGVLFVNHNLAEGYSHLYYQSPRNVLGIGPNPSTEFNPEETIPVTHGRAKPYAGFRNRIVGEVTLVNRIAVLEQVMGYGDSIRADEGFPFKLGRIRRFLNRVTMHALEETGITAGNGFRVGYHSLIHGGADVPNAPESDTTVVGNDVTVGSFSVVFRSKVGNNVKIGNKVLLDHCDIPDNAVIPDGTVMIGNEVVRMVQW